MIFVALGANLEHPLFGPPRATCEAALRTLAAAGVAVVARSRWYGSAPVPPSGQPWFVNGVAAVESRRGPAELLGLLHRIEAAFGRERRVRNEARVLDLDLIDYGGQVSGPDEQPQLPHPRVGERSFVLLPLAELAPDWHHPVSGRPIAELVRGLPAEGLAEPLD
jgi:2-amino-4-hydroxy-6-hydroxymethyldihydropteridine diphosphokinase